MESGKTTEFRFKRFIVRNRHSAMKVNTDGVILGAAMTLRHEDKRLLDIGTGTGTIALMVSQRLSGMSTDSGRTANFKITGIDIDHASAEEAGMNFGCSPWADNLDALDISLDGYASGLPADFRFDHIFSNPPYFSGELKAPEERRRNARHSESLSWTDIIGFAERFLSEDGLISLVLPADQQTMLRRYAASKGFSLLRLLKIMTVPGKEPKRIVAELSRHRTTPTVERLLTIQEKGTYTDEYRSLLKDFLVIF